MDHKQIVVVLGMHRSGTSAITRGLQVLGVELGSNLLSPEVGINDKGFWEDVDVTAFNDEFLKELGHDWHTLTPIMSEELDSSVARDRKLRAVELLRNKLSDIDCFGVKDPRIARLLPFWQSVFAELDLKVSYVVAFRNPKSVAHSLVKRNEFELEKGYFLWLEHMLLSLKYSQGASRVFVNYDLMLQDPEQQLKRISAALDLPFDPRGPEFLEYQHKFLQHSLQHNNFTLEELKQDAAVSVDILKLSKLLLELSSDLRADDQALEGPLDELYRAMLERLPAYRLMRRFDENNADLAGQLVNQAARSDQSISALETEFASLKADRTALQTHLGTLESHVSTVQSVLAESERSMQTLEADLRRYASGRFLIKSLAALVAERFGFRYQGDNPGKSELFDANYYLSTYEDVRAAGVNPLQHYLEQGWREGRDPSAGFSTQAYLNRYEDVRLRRINPLVHYLRHGYYEGRSIYDTKGRNYHLSRKVSRNRTVVQLLNMVVQQPELLGRFIREARRGGLRHAVAIATRKLKRSKKLLALEPTSLCNSALMKYEVLKVVPYYLDPYKQDVAEVEQMKVAVHLHLNDGCLAETGYAYLANIPVEFDLYVSIPGDRDRALNDKAMRAAVPLLRKLVVEQVPANIGHIAPFIIQFGSRLSVYDYVAHFHASASMSYATEHSNSNDLMDLLCGSKNHVAQIFGLLNDDAKVVYPVENLVGPDAYEQAGWSDTRGVIQTTLEQYSQIDSAAFPTKEFPRCGMFWARASAIESFVHLPLQYEDFAGEPETAAPAMLARCLERLLLICTTQMQGRNYQLESPQLSREPLAYYEPQCDYSDTIVHDSIKVLAYYLPQFHPTPENDEWHGAGFTEWHKVRSANPLFYGHYQQHVPHEDIGYYHLDSPAQLSQQADMMQKSGVHGLIFYHYWFSGKLILEKPAQMLLDNPQINIPFSFCWANENWTRRWDGNEQEILLGQIYSKDDARAFIQYVIPFFKDERYIKIEGRPVLFVYRPSSMEHVDDYMAIWRQECESNGLKAPYVVATLTRGATLPQDYGMEAAVERVLHDWTGDAVDDKRDELRPYWPLNGSVLEYSEVADHYMGQDLGKDCTLFRSLVPTWDNTARYGSNAYVLNNFTTAKFQSWMEYLVQYSEQNLPADRRFLVVNAWNEWAEGAHLEPDTRFGYGYLNSIGRALSGQSFSATDHFSPDSNLTLKVVVTPGALSRLQAEPESRRKFLTCLASSSVFERCGVVVEDAQLNKALQALGVRTVDLASSTADFTLVFSDACLFSAEAIESLLKMAQRHKGFGVSASVRNDPAFLQSESTVNFTIDAAQRACMELLPAAQVVGYKVSCEASCFHLLPQVGSTEIVPETVSTIMRFHSRGDRLSLVNALLSLIAQSGCRVKPVLAIQDMSDEEIATLEVELARLPWSIDCAPVIRRYFSTEQAPDLRSLMLNDTLKAVGTGYAAFLDYDDVLFPDAYSVLLEQLKASGKNATFARVYSTIVDATTGCIIKRDKIYDYGDSYLDFVSHNHAPLHSFMLDLDKCDLEAIHYFDDMKYMEDYYLTMQLFSRSGTDWASLQTCGFIGDYIHRIGGDDHTLALTDEQQREDLLGNESYRICEARIKAMRDRLLLKV